MDLAGAISCCWEDKVILILQPQFKNMDKMKVDNSVGGGGEWLGVGFSEPALGKCHLMYVCILKCLFGWSGGCVV